MCNQVGWNKMTCDKYELLTILSELRVLESKLRIDTSLVNWDSQPEYFSPIEIWALRSVIWRPISSNPGLNFNPRFLFKLI